jgi:transposase-like protein
MTRILDITKSFSKEEPCRQYLEKLRWPNGVECVTCNEKHISKIVSRGKTGKPRHLYQCLSCRTQFSVRTGTILRDSHLPLTVWFKAIALVCGSKQRIKAASLRNDLNVNYRTASFLLNRIYGALESGGHLEV